MSRQEKIGAAVLGLLLFTGLFYFIYTTMKNPLAAGAGDEEFFGETFEDEEFDDEAADLPEAEEEPGAEPAAEAPAEPAAPKK